MVLEIWKTVKKKKPLNVSFQIYINTVPDNLLTYFEISSR